MKVTTLFSLTALLSTTLSTAIPTTAPLTKHKRWTVSDPRQTGAHSYTVTVISGIIVSNALSQCQYDTGADWAGAFAEGIINHWVVEEFGIRDLITSIEGYYPTSNTVNLYCTTLAVRIAFGVVEHAEAFADAARDYMNRNAKRGVVSEVNGDLLELPEFNNTELGKREASAVSCKNGCKFDFGSEDTGICHDDWGKISKHSMMCKV
jgi:hypothetical protein